MADIWSCGVPARPDGIKDSMADLKITVWNVGDGNAISIEFPTPDCKLAMVDIGSTADFSPICAMMQKGHRSLEWLIITHPHSDHFEDVCNLKTLGMEPQTLHRVKDVPDDLIREKNPEVDSVDSYLELDKRYTANVPECDKITNLANTGGVDVKIFKPKSRETQNINDYSLVLVVSYQGEKILLPGDITPASMNGLLEDREFLTAIMGTKILVAPHHGRESCFCAELFDYINPELCIISKGEDVSENSATTAYDRVCLGGLVYDSARNPVYRKCLSTLSDGDVIVVVDDFGRRMVSCSGRMN